jgi:lysophospholipase L1-like esterase
VAVVVVAVLAVAIGATWWSRRDDRVDLVVVGDSVSYLSAGQTERRLGDDYDIEFLTTPGYTTKQELVLLRDAMSRDDGPAAAREVVAVLVGYNDLRLDTVGTDALADLVEETSRWRCAVWLTLPERPGGQASSEPAVSPEKVGAWNDRLAAEIEPYDDVHLVNDWQDAVHRNPEAELLSDGLHPTEAGRRRLADSYRAAIERHC